MHEMAILKVDELQVWEDLPAHGRADDHLPQVGRGHRLRFPAGQRVRTQVKFYYIMFIVCYRNSSILGVGILMSKGFDPGPYKTCTRTL